MSAVALAIKELQHLQPQDLRAVLDRHFPNAVPVPRRTQGGVSTGIAELDALFPNGGLPKGRLSVWAPAGGATALLRATAFRAVGDGERVAWIDGCGTISGAFWTSGPVLVRPQNRLQALRAADVLLRSGGFGLIILAGIESEGNENVKLARAAHEGGGAFVVLSTNAAMAGVKVISSITPDGYVWRRTVFGDPALLDSVTLRVNVASLGWNRKANVTLAVRAPVERVALDATLPDRRGHRSLKQNRPVGKQQTLSLTLP